ncbi:MAG: copper-binding protein [Burkholderiales bacterium]|nr:copper-binding protein [Burkholderiales bacterium]
METRKFFVFCALAASLLISVHAQIPNTPAQGMSSASAGHLAVGVVKAIDAKNRALTISHQAIASMGMPAMTMAFKADVSVDIASLKPGDAIAFVLSARGSAGPAITSLQAMPGGAVVSQAPMEGMQGMPHASGKSMMEQCHEMMMKRN